MHCHDNNNVGTQARVGPQRKLATIVLGTRMVGFLSLRVLIYTIALLVYNICAKKILIVSFLPTQSNPTCDHVTDAEHAPDS